MREPGIGDAVHCRGRTRGRIDMVTEHNGHKVFGVFYEGALEREFYTAMNLEWDPGRSMWVVVG